MIRNFLVTLKLFLNAKCSLFIWIKWQIGHKKWFLNTNKFLIKTFRIAKFDCIILTGSFWNLLGKYKKFIGDFFGSLGEKSLGRKMCQDLSVFGSNPSVSWIFLILQWRRKILKKVSYSYLSNKQVDSNNRVGWNFSSNLIYG